MKRLYIRMAVALAAVLLAIAFGDAFLSKVSVQRGYDGTGMVLIKDKDDLTAISEKNVAPLVLPPAVGEGTKAAEAYKNVQVLGGLTTSQFTRLMTSITMWVAPEQGCAYCHNTENLASDELYTKVVSRRMFQMVQHINNDWGAHVAQTGVTCYTCHRGKPVPEYIWFEQPEHPQAHRAVGNPMEQNMPGALVGLTSLPTDSLSPFLVNSAGVRIVGTEALPYGNRSSIKQAEWTYGLMMHMSESLGVNCTYCHNTQAFADWSKSPVARTTAWHGIQMARELNNEFLLPLRDKYPANRLGVNGDPPKLNCQTCHQGAYKPLLGLSLMKDYPSLSGPTPYVPPPVTETATTAADQAEPAPEAM